MTIINSNTKKAMQMIDRAMNYEGSTLEEVYGRVSDAKKSAFYYCKKLCNDENGYNFHICSHNTFQYSVAWETENAYRIETANNSFCIYKN